MNYLLYYDFSMYYEWSIVLWIIYYVMIYELVSDIRKKKVYPTKPVVQG